MENHGRGRVTKTVRVLSCGQQHQWRTKQCKSHDSGCGQSHSADSLNRYDAVITGNMTLNLVLLDSPEYEIVSVNEIMT